MSFLFATKKPSKGVVEKYEGLGFSPDVIKKAWKACKGDEKKMMDQLFTLNQPPQLEPKPDPPTMKPAKVKMEPTFVQVPIEKKKSNKAPEKPIPRDVAVRASYEPLNAEQRIRPNGLPVGLKNVGNTCYFNSLFQTYFMSETFVSSVLRYDPKVSFVDDYLSVSTSKKGEDDIKRIRIEASIKLVQNLQRLFAKMIKSHKRYVDPTEVLESVVDDTGEKITVGNQRDITEYHLNFLSRIEDAFFYQDKFLEAREDSSESKPIRIKDLPESYVNSATLRNQLSSEALGNSGNSIIKNHFFGEMKQIMNFTQNDEPKTEEKDLVFGPVILDVMHKDFYTALEAYCNFTLDDYRTRNGEVTDAKGQIWITKPPELLFVQLNRVGYDKKTNMPVKSSKKFDFDKEIYLDRFSLDCRDEAYLINRRIGSLKTELNQKENTLQKLMSTFDGKSDILNMFDFMENFLQKQVNFEGSPSHVDQDPTIVGMIEESHKMQAAMDVIYAYKHHFQVKIAQLKESIVKIKETINKLWSKLNRRKYHLVSILIHDGDAESGHYYSFNRNIQKNTWNRFNDYYVTEEKEEVVLTEALGGFGNMSAYCLVYLADENIQEEINLNTTELKDLFAREETDVEVEKSYYKKLLTPILTQEVVADNIAFQDEVEEFQSTAYIKSVVESYKVHYNSLAKALQANSSIVPPPHLNTFGTFLKNDSYCDSALKWYIIDGILQNSQQSPQMKHLPKLSLRNLKDFPQLFLKAQHQFSSLASPYKVSSLTLTSSIENQLEIKLSEYTAEYPIIVYVRFILKAFRKGNWKDACHAIKLFLNMETNDKSYLSKLVRESTRVACLIMILKAENYAIQGQFDECSEILQHISALVKGVLKPDEFHISQIRMIWFEFLNETKSSLPDDSRPVFKEHFRAFSQNTHSITELDKITENYASFELQRKLGKINGEDLYAWKDLGEKSCAAIIRKAFERFKYDFQIIIEFHTHLLTNKTLLNAVDRKRLGFQIF